MVLTGRKEVQILRGNVLGCGRCGVVHGTRLPDLGADATSVVGESAHDWVPLIRVDAFRLCFWGVCLRG